MVCEFGNPLRIGEDWQRCELNSDCPRLLRGRSFSHILKRFFTVPTFVSCLIVYAVLQPVIYFYSLFLSINFPSLETICAQPKRIGDCTGSVSRYWYNAATQQCEMFDVRPLNQFNYFLFIKWITNKCNKVINFLVSDCNKTNYYNFIVYWMPGQWKQLPAIAWMPTKMPKRCM